VGQPALLREKLFKMKLVQVSQTKPRCCTRTSPPSLEKSSRSQRMRSSSRLAKPNQAMLLHAAQPALLREKLSENEKLVQVS
jgi:hypothetical protein